MSNKMNRFDWERCAMTQPFKGEALRVLWCYASHADADTLITFPTVRQVADETGISVEKVGNYRRELLATGWLVESAEKTSRGNAKLMLAAGENVTAGYLGEKRRMNSKSVGNLIPAAKQKKQAGSLDFPDEAGLENREKAGLENADIEALDFPDVTTSELNNHSLTISDNQKEDAPVVADAPAVTCEVREEAKRNEESSLEYHSLTEFSEVPFEVRETSSGFTYFLFDDGVTRLTEQGEACPDFWSEEAIGERIAAIGSVRRTAPVADDERW